jgi:hypothetical protein
MVNRKIHIVRILVFISILAIQKPFFANLGEKHKFHTAISGSVPVTGCTKSMTG